MCNLYRMTKGTDEVARLFGTTLGSTGNFATDLYPGYPGLVVVNGELRSMVWGFPLTLTSKKTGQPLKPKPVNNARADKLDSFMWRYSFAERRCLIPVSKFAEAEGATGSKNRTWFFLPDQDVFAVAGIWRDTDEWGPAYSMVMTEACVQSRTSTTACQWCCSATTGQNGLKGRQKKRGSFADLIPLP
jgi:putative SOS response-associated peptidase YedK